MEDIKIYFVDDEQSFLTEVAEYFSNFDLKTESDPRKAVEELHNACYDIVVTDYRMPEINGIELLIEGKKNNGFCCAILLTAYADMEILENAINKNLITKYIPKPVSMKLLKESIIGIVTKCRKIKEQKEEKDQYQLKYTQLLKEINVNDGSIVGLEKGLLEVKRKAEYGARYLIPIMLTGETGTGKEVIARLIHQLSDRKEEIFTSVNCAAFPENLIESELFGYEKGAFTGAEKAKIGRIEMSHNGTLFLDEIGDLKLDLQTKLLRVLQEKKIERLGSNLSRNIDFRLITATNKNLKKAIKEKTFREDLYYRISGFPIDLPPLRERKEDIEDLTLYFINKFSREMGVAIPAIDPEIFPLLAGYNWPGNIRQLEWTIKRILILTSDIHSITKEDFDLLLKQKKNESYKLKQAIHILKNLIIKKEIDLKDIRKMLIKTILKEFNHDVKEAVKNTSISLSSFYRSKE